MNYNPQVDRLHYEGKAYRSEERWSSYFHQLTLVRRAKPKTVLEIGPGEGAVSFALARDGVRVTTVDIAPDLKPDIVASVTDLPLEAGSFDTVLAAEVLEHIRFEDVPRALSEIRRVARHHAIISLPHPGYVFSLSFKMPLLPRVSFLLQVPFFWRTHVFNGEHYWELGKRGFPVSRFLRCARDAGLRVESSEKYADDPAHRFFLFSV
jgi:SAM-dependent methyltransferase